MNLITVILALALLFVIILLGGGLIIYIYWWLVQRPGPQHEGELELPELDATVEVLRDQHGIPTFMPRPKRTCGGHRDLPTPRTVCGKWNRTVASRKAAWPNCSARSPWTSIASAASSAFTAPRK